MKLHPKLKAFEGRKNISKMSKILTALEKDLASVQQTHLSVEIIEEQDERSTYSPDSRSRPVPWTICLDS